VTVQGFTRMRKHQFGRQGAMGTPVPATAAYPFKGTPSVDLKWTDPDVDTGSIDPVADPYREAPEVTAPLTDPALAYNTIPLLLSALFGGGVTASGGGTAKTWTHDPASVTVDPFDVFTYEFGDDVADDGFQLGDGILESLEISGPEGLGALSTSMSWRFGSVASTGSTDSPVTGSVPTPALDVDPNAVKVYLKDMALFICDDPDYLAANQVSDALHSFTLRINQAIDQKRFANGDQSFDVDAYGRGAREIQLGLVFAKTADTVGTGSESDDWLSDQPVTRYLRLKATSTVLAQAPSTYYGWQVTMPLRYYTRSEGAVGGNSTVELTGHAFYDPDLLEAVLKSIAVTTRAAL
jgi:hypothetical protein